MGAPRGNKNAAKAKVFHDMLLKLCVQEDWQRLRDGLGKMLDEASRGQEWALVLVRDTLDGKPKQQIDADIKGGPFTVVLSEADAKL